MFMHMPMTAGRVLSPARTCFRPVRRALGPRCAGVAAAQEGILRLVLRRVARAAVRAATGEGWGLIACVPGPGGPGLRGIGG